MRRRADSYETGLLVIVFPTKIMREGIFWGEDG